MIIKGYCMNTGWRERILFLRCVDLWTSYSHTFDTPKYNASTSARPLFKEGEVQRLVGRYQYNIYRIHPITYLLYTKTKTNRRKEILINSNCRIWIIDTDMENSLIRSKCFGDMGLYIKINVMASRRWRGSKRPVYSKSPACNFVVVSKLIT